MQGERRIKRKKFREKSQSIMAEKILDTMFLFLVLCASLTDIRKREIPDGIPAAMAFIAAAAAWSGKSVTLSEQLAGIFCLSLPMALLACIRPGTWGGGDIKLAAAGGGFLGIRRMLAAGAVAILTAAFILGILTVRKKITGKDEVPFAPFLGAGMAAGLLWGFEMASWYIGG